MKAPWIFRQTEARGEVVSGYVDEEQRRAGEKDQEDIGKNLFDGVLALRVGRFSRYDPNFENTP